jgi:CubicO group peptidase (beta-lactamase class C family)
MHDFPPRHDRTIAITPGRSSAAAGRARRWSRRHVLAGLGALPLLAIGACGGSSDDDAPETQTATPTTPSAPAASSSPLATPPPATVSASAPASPSPASGDAYFPPPSGDWEQVDLQAAGWSKSGLDQLIGVVRDNKSATFMLLSGGRIVTENYFSVPGVGTASAATRLDVASVQKSVTSTLIGIAREKGLLQLDDSVTRYLGAGWSQATAADEATITLRQLMTHASGLNETLRKVAEPGTTFSYNTTAYQRLRPVLEKVAGSDINALSQAWMFQAIGIPGATWKARTAADRLGEWGLDMTAREMARFGLLALRRGQWAGMRVVADAWFSEAWQSSAVKIDYGLLWWLMGKGPLGAIGGPGDWVAALGARDQKIYVVPSMDLVVVRQGLAANAETESVSDFDRILFRAIAAARA